MLSIIGEGGTRDNIRRDGMDVEGEDEGQSLGKEAGLKWADLVHDKSIIVPVLHHSGLN